MAGTAPTRRDFLATGAAVTAVTTATAAQTREAVVAAVPAQPGPRASTLPIRILTTTAFDSEEIRTIQRAAPQVELVVAKTRAEFRDQLPDAEVVYGSVNAAELQTARRLKWVQAGGENVRRYALGVPLINVVDKKAGY